MYLMLSRYKCTPWKCRKKFYSSSKNERETVNFVYSFILALSLEIDVVPLVACARKAHTCMRACTHPREVTVWEG